ncbi:MAG: hypothetical protein M3O41_13285, partial [Pseudomonadota bacterium]|nr:hypothetical protein [Pseudomonadota bacterium]
MRKAGFPFHCIIFIRNDVYEYVMRQSADYGKECRASCQAGQNALARKRDFHCLGCLGKSLLVGDSTMRTGRSYS